MALSTSDHGYDESNEEVRFRPTPRNDIMNGVTPIENIRKRQSVLCACAYLLMMITIQWDGFYQLLNLVTIASLAITFFEIDFQDQPHGDEGHEFGKPPVYRFTGFYHSFIG